MGEYVVHYVSSYILSSKNVVIKKYFLMLMQNCHIRSNNSSNLKWQQ